MEKLEGDVYVMGSIELDDIVVTNIPELPDFNSADIFDWINGTPHIASYIGPFDKDVEMFNLYIEDIIPLYRALSIFMLEYNKYPDHTADVISLPYHDSQPFYHFDSIMKSMQVLKKDAVFTYTTMNDERFYVPIFLSDTFWDLRIRLRIMIERLSIGYHYEFCNRCKRREGVEVEKVDYTVSPYIVATVADTSSHTYEYLCNECIDTLKRYANRVNDYTLLNQNAVELTPPS